ncbi:MAG: four helix bundle protein [Melioribacteraceae bacterium]
MAKTFRELIVWQKSITLVTHIYEVTSNFPKEEIYGITSQLRRAAISIPSNIAEGFGRNSKKEFVRFLRITFGSIFELQTQLEISNNLKFLSLNDFNKIYDSTREIEAMLASLIKKINSKS